MLWGPNKNLDFWTARSAGHVPAPEQRAVALLAKHSEERRFSIYCRTGQMAAMGNMTRRIYLIRRFAGVLELVDGHPQSSWCMNGGGRNRLPETDHVVAMKLMIEGEEYVFRTTGNPTPAARWKDEPRFSHPYDSSFGGDECRARGDDDLNDVAGLEMRTQTAKAVMKSSFEQLRFRQWLSHKARLEQARHGQGRDFEESQKGAVGFGNTGIVCNSTFIGGAGLMITGGTANLCAAPTGILGTGMNGIQFGAAQTANPEQLRAP